MEQEVRRVAILGCTGSIGRQALDVVRAHPERFEVVALAAGSDRDGMASLAAELGVSRTGLGAEEAAAIAGAHGVDVVLNAVVGAAGLRSSLAALRAGKLLALANKESLVAGGDLCREAAAAGGGTIVPVDSEHAAIAQCLQGRAPASEVASIVLTASGGPFRTRRNLSGVTPADALAHPTWTMGPKITVDSATLMNKGLEAIEAHHLFDVGYDRIKVLVHPQSIVHGMVEWVDGSTVMQAAPPDMRLPIQAALAHPERVASLVDPVDLAAQGALSFESVDQDRFPCLSLAYEAGRRGRSYPTVLNAVNEVAVNAFLQERLAFTDIPRVIESVMSEHDGAEVTGLSDLEEIDGWARTRARQLVPRGALSPQPTGTGA